MLVRLKYLWIIVITCALTLLLIFATRPAPRKAVQLPDLPAENLTGDIVNLARFTNKALVINFWATWCGPCRRELPLFVGMAQQHPNVTFVFVNQKETREQIKAFLQDENVTLENVVLDTDGALADHFKVFGLPSTFFFDARGMLITSQLGEVSSVQLFNVLSGVTR